MLSLLLAATVLALDLFTKWLVTTRMTEFQEIPVMSGFFSLQFVHNQGASFGMLSGHLWLLVLVSLVAIGGILYFLRHPDSRVGLLPYALGMILGGAVGNLLDRIRFGQVVDFLLFYWREYHFPNFNVADIAINIGVALFLLHMFLTREIERREDV